MTHKTFFIGDWRPISPDEFVWRLHALQRESVQRGMRVEMETSDVCKDQFATEFSVGGLPSALLLHHASLEQGTEQVPYRRR